ncbi:hypothetical protein NLU13_8879 [Sarocladium strictum]|uniref:Uncharacterized protein n=1 Tax=Sarocladium strictum TaxID=5046 RepID=A0AA39GA89_SARSR|nr:hypothetical protein NLU13_8879 [Sarocladium strictum]
MKRTAIALAFLALASHTTAASDKDDKGRVGHSKSYKDIDWTLVKYDPDTADTVEDAAWNCIVDFAEIEPDWACDFRNSIAQDYADMCTPTGNVEMMRRLVYPFCDLRTKTKPQKRPFLKKNQGQASGVKVDVDVSVDVNVLTGGGSGATTTVTAAGRPVVVNVDASHSKTSTSRKAMHSATTSSPSKSVTVTRMVSVPTVFKTVTVTRSHEAPPEPAWETSAGEEIDHEHHEESYHEDDRCMEDSCFVHDEGCESMFC